VSWSGGNGATTFSYSVSSSNGGPAITTAKFTDKGLASKSVIVYNLSGNTTYWLTINANSTLKSTSSPSTSFRTKSWVLTVPYGLYGAVNGASFAGGPQNAAQRDGKGEDNTFSGNTTMAIDNYDNIYLYEVWATRCVRVISLTTTIVYTIPFVDLGTNSNPTGASIYVDKDRGIIYLNNRNGTIMKMVPNTFPLTNNGTTITSTWTTTKFISASSSTSPAGAPTIVSGVSTNTDNFGIAVDTLGNLYFISVSGSTYSLTKVNVNNNNALTVISGVSSDIASKINRMCFDSFNNLWASLTSINKILMVTPSGIATIYGSGSTTPSNGPLSNFGIYAPSGISSDKNGTVYISEGDAYHPLVRRITNGNVDTVLGDSALPTVGAAISGYNLSLENNLPFSGGTFKHSFYAAFFNVVDSTGNVYILPQHIICKFSLT
jgi:hypothetical protein